MDCHNQFQFNQLKSNILQVDETRFAKKMNEMIKGSHQNLPKDLEIPFLFIDPVVKIFNDACFAGTEPMEREQFQKYTDR